MNKLFIESISNYLWIAWCIYSLTHYVPLLFLFPHIPLDSLLFKNFGSSIVAQGIFIDTTIRLGGFPVTLPSTMSNPFPHLSYPPLFPFSIFFLIFFLWSSFSFYLIVLNCNWFVGFQGLCFCTEWISRSLLWIWVRDK